MTDLTDKWKKGELPVDKDYYIKLKSGLILIDYYCQLYDNCHFPNGIGFDSIPENDIVEVLAPVPSYEEWQASENYIDYLKQCISVYESKEKQHTDDAIAYNELAKENEELKEILERHKKATAKAQIRSCDLEIINAQLKERNDSLNNRDINLCRIANGIRDENFALKELLRECESLFNRSTVDGEEPTSGELIIILTKIEEALK